MTLKNKSLTLCVLSLLIILLLLLAAGVAADAAPGVSWNSRAGVAFDRHESGQTLLDYDLIGLGANWAYDFYTERYPRKQEGLEYVQMIWRPANDAVQIAGATGAAVVNPGSIWMVGNECDNGGQCALTPDQYAIGYHAHYTAIKASDPTALIFAGGITQPTPIRLRWLDAVLVAYQNRYGVPLPADGWHIHMYILPEACDWGVGMPVGLSNAGDAFDCSYGDRHAELAVFVSRLADFRLWMRLNGYQQTPLIVSEYGVLLGPEHGYSEQRVADYLRDTFAYMGTATDTANGYQADDNRLVQRWAWFSVNYRPFPGTALFDFYNKTLTIIGRAYATTVAQKPAGGTPTAEPATRTPTATTTVEPTAVVQPTATATPLPPTSTDQPTATATTEPTNTPEPTFTIEPTAPSGEAPTGETGSEPRRRLYLPLVTR